MWRRNRKKKEKENPGSDKLARGIAGAFLGAQAGFASFMNRKTAALTARSQKLLLFFVCALFGGLSLLVLVNAFVLRQDAHAFSKPSAIQVPQHIGRTNEENAGLVVSKKEYE